MSSVHVIAPGLQTTVQDLGRWGLQARGVPVAGPMDPTSHRAANALAGNPPDAATLEVTLVGPELHFDDERTIAIAGAEFVIAVDESVAPVHQAVRVRAGSHVRFGARRLGARAYLAIEGGVATPALFGSRATHVGSRMGGIDGRALTAGDRIPLGARRLKRPHAAVVHEPFRDRAIGKTMLPLVTDRLERDGARLAGRVRMLPGSQFSLFSGEAIERLQAGRYSITSESNRMGYRLEGPILEPAGSVTMISEATPLGSIQVPPSGQPILLMADRQTTGGYPKMAVVIAADIAVAGQLAPGDTIQCEFVSLGQALAALVAQERRLMAIEGRIA